MAVLGLLCVNRNFRADFFEQPAEKAQQLCGPMSGDELEQIQRLAGKAVLPLGRTRDQFVVDVQQACENVFQSLQCTCPTPPCPCPDNSDLY
jgi:hypothetical protein